MLSEQMRLAAGLQECKIVENPLYKLMETEKIAREEEKKKLMNKKDVVSDFDIFQEQFEKYKKLIDKVSLLFEERNKNEFMKGVFNSKYTNLRCLANIIINEGFSSVITYIDQHYDIIEKDVNHIIFLNEEIDEKNAQTFFVSKALFSHDTSHNVKIPVFKDKLLDEKISNEIPYGSEIIFISEDLSLIRHSGKKFYTKLMMKDIAVLEEKGFLI